MDRKDSAQWERYEALVLSEITRLNENNKEMQEKLDKIILAVEQLPQHNARIEKLEAKVEKLETFKTRVLTWGSVILVLMNLLIAFKDNIWPRS